MKNYIAALFILLAISFSHAQKTPTAIKVTYLKTSNGKLVENQDPVVIFANLITTVITSQNILDKKSGFPYEQSYVDRQTGYYCQFAQLNATKTTMTVDSTAIGKQTFEILDDTKMILGYKCRKAKTVINSNTIELWYTDELKLKGAPTVLGQNLGLVLEMTRNGNYTFSAEEIVEMKSIPSIVPQKKIKKADILTYRDLLWKNRFTIIPVFKNEIINFSDKSKSNDSVFKYANGTIILRKIKIPEIKKGSQIFVDVSEQSNGDAYDRTGSVFIIPTDNKLSFLNGLQNSAKELPVYDNGNGKQYQGVVRTESYSPLLELMRFFTPFGVKQYNTIQLKNKTWQDSVYYRQDITDMHPILSGKEIWIGANIGNYDKGGHKISLNLTIHPEEDGKAGSNFILPLFNTNNVMEMAGQEYATMFNNDKGLEVSFTLAANVKNAKLRYITTGHGGWENGDEFVQKKNTILLDGKSVYSFIPWRMDCGSFRSYNPASGNFNNGLSSSDYSRSNWCPGTVTNPVYIDLGNLAAGKHTIQIKIPQGEPEGNSFSSWNVSGILIGDK
jgi:GLPGLI family protein